MKRDNIYILLSIFVLLYGCQENNKITDNVNFSTKEIIKVKLYDSINFVNFSFLYPQEFTKTDIENHPTVGLITLINSDQNEIALSYKDNMDTQDNAIENYIKGLESELIPNIRTGAKVEPVISDFINEDFLNYNLTIRKITYKKNIIYIYGFEAENTLFRILAQTDELNNSETIEIIKEIIKSIKFINKNNSKTIAEISNQNEIKKFMIELELIFKNSDQIHIESLNYDKAQNKITLALKWENLDEKIFDLKNWGDFSRKAKEKQIGAFNQFENLRKYKEMIIKNDLKLQYKLISKNNQQIADFIIDSTDLK